MFCNELPSQSETSTYIIVRDVPIVKGSRSNTPGIGRLFNSLALIFQHFFNLILNNLQRQQASRYISWHFGIKGLIQWHHYLLILYLVIISKHHSIIAKSPFALLLTLWIEGNNSIKKYNTHCDSDYGVIFILLCMGVLWLHWECLARSFVTGVNISYYTFYESLKKWWIVQTLKEYCFMIQVYVRTASDFILWI